MTLRPDLERSLASAITIDLPSHNIDVSVDFLARLRPLGPWVLTAIVPDGGTVTQTSTTAESIRQFITVHNGKRNLYYSLNPTKGVMTKKAAKADIAAAEFVHADLDPRDDETPVSAKLRYSSQLASFEPRPTAIINSGNGIQALWRLQAPVGPDQFSEVEARSLALTRQLGSAPGTQNVDRILRLPGTINLPNKKKVRSGRVQCPTTLIEFNDAVHPLGAFPTEAAALERSAPDAPIRNAGAPVKCSPDDLIDLPISERIKNLIRGIDDPEYVYESRSERVFAVLRAMTGADCADSQIFAVMQGPIGEHVREQNNPDRYLARQIAQARKASTDPNVAKLNETFALVIVGDKIAILRTSNEGIKFWTLQTFDRWHDNRFVQRGRKRMPLAKYWLQHPQRRQYEGLTFAPKRDVPNHFNLWRGFTVQPQAGDCSKFLGHLRDNVCRGEAALYLWVVGWFAQIFQHPDEKIGTSLVLRGKQGTGKTKVGQVIGGLLGEHYAPVSDPRYVTGQFNSHLVSCLLLHCDEGFWAGDLAAAGKLKDLVTGNEHFIEYKGKEPIRVHNYVRLFVTGNSDWVIPAGFEERRFAVLDIGEAQLQNTAYFAAIDEEMKNGGRAALLYHLLNFDLKQVKLREIPKTAALLDQKLSSLTPETGWWLDVLTSGELPWGCDDVGRCPAFRLFNRYIRHANRRGSRRRAIETQVGMFLTKHAPGLRKSVGTYKRWKPDNHEMVDAPGTIYAFPALAECRAAFSKMMQQEIDWNEREAWVHEPAPDDSGEVDDDPPF